MRERNEKKKAALSHMGTDGKALSGYALASPSQFMSDLDPAFADTHNTVPATRGITAYTNDTFTYNARLFNVPSGRGIVLYAVPYVVYHIADTYRVVYGDMANMTVS